MGVAVGGFNFNYAFTDFKNRNIKRSAAEVVNGDGLVLTFIQTVSQRRRRRLIDDSLHIKTGDLPGVFRRLALRVIKVSGHGNHRLGHFFSEIVFGRFLQLLQDQRRNLRRRVPLALRHYGYVVALTLHFVWDHLHFFCHFVEAPSHEALDRINRVLGIGDGLSLGHLSYQPLAGLGEADDRRSGPSPFFVRYDLGLTALHDGHAGVGGAEVNSDNLGHNWLLSLL